MKRMKRSIRHSVAAVVMAIVAAPTLGQTTIDPASRIADVPTSPGLGLSGSVFNDVSVVSLPAWQSLAVGVPDATFTSTSLDYPAGATDVAASDTTSVSSFLGTDGASLSGTDAPDLNDILFHFTGVIALEEVGTYDLVTGSNDGFAMFIGGDLVASAVVNRTFTTDVDQISVAEAGIYEFELFFQGGPPVGTGLEVTLTPPAGGSAILATPLLYDPSFIPEPASLALLGIGGLTLLRRTRREA